MDLREVLAALRATWWLPVLGLVLGGTAALGLSLLQTPLYTSSSQLFVSTTDSTTAADALQGGQLAQDRAASYTQVLTSVDLASRVVERLGLSMSPGQLRDRIQATAVTDTVVIDVSVTDPSPVRARAIADALNAEFIATVSRLETPGGVGQSPINVTVTDSPKVPDAPTSPNKRRNVALGLLAGVSVGAALSIAGRRFETSVKDPAEAAELAGAPVIGTVLRDAALKGRRVLHRGAPNRVVEDYRVLRTNLQFLNVDDPPKVIMISSAAPSEGKTTAVINLAIVLADAQLRVTILEADLRCPEIAGYLGLADEVGLTNILAGTADAADVTQTYGENLSVITSGPLPPNPGELLGSNQMAALVEKLRSRNDVVLVDAPPVLPVADARALAVAMDGVLLCARYGSTRKSQLRQTAAALDAVGAKTLGVILNAIPAKADPAQGQGYGRPTKPN